MSSDRDRQRARRSRQAAGLLPVSVDIEEVSWVIALTEAGFLAETDQEDRRAIGRALTRLLDLLLKVDLAQLVSQRDNV